MLEFLAQYEIIFPFITTTISLLFVLSVSEQYYRKRKPHQLTWAIAMFLFLITAGAEGVALLLQDWPEWMYRMYYVLAAVQVTFMGGGVLYLFASRGVIHEKNSARAMLIHGFPWVLFGFLFYSSYGNVFLLVLIPSTLVLLLALLTILQTPVVKDTWHKYVTGWTFAHFFMGFTLFIFTIMNVYAWTAPLNLETLSGGRQISGLGWELTDEADGRALVRLFSPLHTIPGGIALIGGGFYSYIVWQLALRRKGIQNWKTGFFNVNIAFGAFILGQGAFFSGLGFPTLYIAEVFSVSLMYLGFMQSDKVTQMKFFDAVTMKYIWSKGIGNENLTT